MLQQSLIPPKVLKKFLFTAILRYNFYVPTINGMYCDNSKNNILQLFTVCLWLIIPIVVAHVVFYAYCLFNFQAAFLAYLVFKVYDIQHKKEFGVVILLQKIFIC